MKRCALALSLLVLAGCPQDVSPLSGNKDGGTDTDAQVGTDGGTVDSGAADSGTPADSGAPDGGACTPDCSGRTCGPDPVCSLSCGQCPADAQCSPQGVCLSTCAPGTFECTADDTGFMACGPNDALGVSDFGPRIACASGAQCALGASQPCIRTECAPLDMMVVVDRSSRIASNSAWSWMKEGLVARLLEHDHEARFGLRQYPDAACAPGPIRPMAEDAAHAVSQNMRAPGPEASNPIGGALMGLSSQFVSGIDTQAVLLVSAGDESCGDRQVAVMEAGRLFRMGVRVYVVAITAQANLTYLNEIAVAGGTGQAYAASSQVELTDHLGTIFDELGACRNRYPQLATGWYHACRLRPSGIIDCWGRNQDDRLRPPLGAHLQIAGGTDNACAVGEDNVVRCWGRNQRGQSESPPGAFVQVAGGDSHFCGLKLDGSLACWGYDDAGQASPPMGSFKQVTAGGFHGCAIALDDTVQCWGGAVAPPGRYKQIDAGGNVTCGLHLDDTLECSHGDAPPTGTFVQLSRGPYHGCAVRTDGTVACWGLNHVQQSEPPSGTFVSVSVNYEYSCGVRPDDSIECWGSGSNGQTTPPN